MTKNRLNSNDETNEFSPAQQTPQILPLEASRNSAGNNILSLKKLEMRNVLILTCT